MTIASYKDEAYHIIKEKIIRLELLPGEKSQENNLCLCWISVILPLERPFFN